MKKLLILTIIGIFTVISCGKNGGKQEIILSSKTISVTLNGIDETTARKLRMNYLNLRNKDTEPVKTSIWFDSTTIRHMYNLLVNEGADGLRLYFITEGITSGHLKNAIILVSTKRNLYSGSTPIDTIHTDYYQHPANNVLFNDLNAIKGQITYGETVDAALYKGCNNCLPETLSGNNNPHRISRQKAEQMVQNFGNHPMNTISEWFDLAMFRPFAQDNVHDGIRIYFGSKTIDNTTFLHDAFVFTRTLPGNTPGTHIDDLGKAVKIDRGFSQTDFDGSGVQDEGELCPANCN